IVYHYLDITSFPTRRSSDLEEVVNTLREKLEVLPGVNLEIGQPISHRIDAMLSGTKANIAIKIFGADLSTLYRLGNEIQSVVSRSEEHTSELQSRENLVCRL